MHLFGSLVSATCPEK